MVGAAKMECNGRLLATDVP